MNYIPRTIDTSSVTLPENVMSVIEKLAENTHKNWSLQRMGEGWKNCPMRYDKKKLHPCFVPHSEFSKSGWRI